MCQLAVDYFPVLGDMHELSGGSLLERVFDSGDEDVNPFDPAVWMSGRSALGGRLNNNTHETWRITRVFSHPMRPPG